MDTCAKGHAVVLKADGARNAFLTGPLDLKPGVTLVVEAKTILFGSRDATVCEVRPGSCGIVSQTGRGCRSVINGTGVAGAGVMGDGTIDGRGWAKIITVAAEHADLTFGPGAVNLKVAGEGVTVMWAASDGTPNACAGKFVAMPEQ